MLRSEAADGIFSDRWWSAANWTRRKLMLDFHRVIEKKLSNKREREGGFLGDLEFHCRERYEGFRVRGWRRQVRDELGGLITWLHEYIYTSDDMSDEYRITWECLDGARCYILFICYYYYQIRSRLGRIGPGPFNRPCRAWAACLAPKPSLSQADLAQAINCFRSVVNGALKFIRISLVRWWMIILFLFSLHKASKERNVALMLFFTFLFLNLHF